MDTTTQVLRVEGRQTQTGLWYDIYAANGFKYSTKSGETATAAQSLIGQPADLRYTHTQKASKDGQRIFDNYYLEAIALQGQLPLAAAALPPSAPAGIPMAGDVQPPSAIHTGIPVVPVVQGDHKFDPERESRIIKQSVLKVAADVVSGLFSGAGPEASDEAFAMLETRAKELYALVYGPQSVVQATPTPEAVADQVNAETAAGAVQVGTGGLKSW